MPKASPWGTPGSCLWWQGRTRRHRAWRPRPAFYVYDPLPVFAFLSYAVRIEKEGFVTKTVNADGVRDGDLSLNVVLEKGDGGAGGIGADGDTQAEYYDLQGVRLSAPEKGLPRSCARAADLQGNPLKTIRLVKAV